MKPILVLPLLIASLQQWAGAAAFDSTGSGNWDNPANWSPAGTPNPFLFDSATINAGHIISYAGAGTAPFPGGNLVVANGNAITINGGTLNQTWTPGAPPPFGTAIAIGVTGPGSGAGTLNINSGGLFDTGTANALAVGISVSAIGASAGNGTININDGTMLLGAGSAPPSPGAQGLAVGVDAGASGNVNVGNATGAAGSAILDLATNNAAAVLGATLSSSSGGTGTMSIFSDGILNQGTGTVTVGDDGGVGTLNIDGGTYNSTTGLLAVADGGTGTLNLKGGVLSTGGAVSVGIAAGGNGNFNVSGGTGTISGETNIGRNAGGNGALTQTGGTLNVGYLAIGRDNGTGSLTASAGNLTASGDINIGRDGTSSGTATVNGGNVTAQHVEIGLGGSSTGTLNVSSGSFGSSLFFNVGRDGGVGAVNQTGGTVTFGEWMAIGLGGGPDGSKYDISGGSIVSGAGIEVGADREATMNISGTADVRTGGLHAGMRAGSNGKIFQTGGAIAVGDMIIGGAQGTGTGAFTKTGGDLTSQNLTVGTNGGSGTFTMSGPGTTTVGNPADTNHGLFVGARADNVAVPASTSGTVNVDGGTLNVNGWVELGRGGQGTVNVTGAGSVLNSYGGKDFQVGMDAGGVGALNITGGGKMSHNWWINVARGGGSTGTLSVEGAGSELSTSAGRIVIGEDGAGTLNVADGGKVIHNSGDRFMVGKNTGSTGIATIAGAGSSVQKNGGEVWVGGDDDGADFGNGTLTVDDGAAFTHVSPSAFLIGINGGTGKVNVSNGGTLTRDSGGATSGDLLLGVGGGSSGELNVTSGGKVNNNWWTVISDNDTATGTVNVDGAGSQINIAQTDQRFVVGRYGKGYLNLTNGGEVNITNAEMHVGMWGSGEGTVTVDSGGKINGQTNASNPDPNARGGVRFIMGTDGGASGSLNLVDGTVSVHSATIGANGMATVNQTGGTFNSNQWTEIGQERDAGAHTPVYNMEGGTLNTQSLSVGQRRNGAMNLTGGTVNVGSNGTVTTIYSGGFHVGNAGPTEDGGSHANGLFNMSGGILNLTEEANIGTQSGAVGVWNMSGGTVNFGVADRRIHVGRRGDGTMTITGGTINGMQGFNVGAEAALAGNPATRGLLTIDLPNAGDVIQAGDLYVGFGNRPTSGQTEGTVNINNGTLRTDGWSEVGRGGAVDGATTGGKGTVNVDGPGSTWEHSLGGTADVMIGYEGGNGALNITNGGKMNHNWWINVARSAASTGSITVDGAGSQLNIVGGLADTNINIGEDGSGTLNVVNGGAVNLHSNAQLWIARNATSTGTVNVVDGSITAPFIQAGGGAVSLNLDSATIKANGHQGDYFRGFNPGNSEIGSGGLIFDTNGFDVTANNAMDGDGGITKKGAGTLALTGVSSYLGLTTVDAGNLQLDGSIAGGLVTNAGATLSGVGNVDGDVTVVGGTISPGDGAGVGDLTVGGAVTLDSDSFVFLTIADEAPGQFDRIVNGGIFSAASATLMGTFSDTSFTLGVTEYAFVTGPTDGTLWGNAVAVPAVDIAAFGLPVDAQEVTLSGQRFYLKKGSWALVPIPEPGSAALGLLCAALFAVRRRR